MKARKNSPKAKDSAPLYSSGSTRIDWGKTGATPLICPDSVRVRLAYETILEPATTLGSLYSYQWRGNSVFDPDYTSAGNQPTGFDQWAAFYNSYVVASSHCEVETVASVSDMDELVILPQFNSTILSSSRDAASARFAKSVVRAGVGNAVYARLKSSISTAQLLGIPNEAVFDDDQYGATVSTNPGADAVWYWTLYLQNVTGTNTLTTKLRVRIIYDVKFYDPTQLNLSAARPRMLIGAHAATPVQGAAGVCACQSCSATAGAPCHSQRR